MNNTGVIDTFLGVFTQYIDSGFGLLGGEVHFLSATLVVIDVTLAALFWAWAPGEDILARLIKKTLYVGFFAFLIGNFNSLAQVVYDSFSGLGLEAAGGGMSASDFLHPGQIAQDGITAGTPILQAISQDSGFPQVFENFVPIVIMLIAFLIVVIAFFILAIQLFVTLIEFKLTTLAGFVLVPFGLFGKTAFLAEKVLGAVVASGVKVLVLAIILGIGSTIFSQFTQNGVSSGVGGGQPTLEQVLALALAALSLLGLGIFGPGIATGLVSGAPQLGAGAAIGTGLAVGGMALAGAAGVRAAAGGLASLKGAAGAASRLGPAGSGDGGLRPPPPGGPSGGGSGGGAAGGATSGGSSSGGSPGGSGAPPTAGAPDLAASAASAASDDQGEQPAWAKRLQHGQAFSHGVVTAAHAVGSGDHGGGGAQVSLSEDR